MNRYTALVTTSAYQKVLIQLLRYCNHRKVSLFGSEMSGDLLKTRPNAKRDVDENGLDVFLGDLMENL